MFDLSLGTAENKIVARLENEIPRCIERKTRRRIEHGFYIPQRRGIIANTEKYSEQTSFSRRGIVFVALSALDAVIFSAVELCSVNISVSVHPPWRLFYIRCDDSCLFLKN